MMSEWKVILLAHGWVIEDEMPNEVQLTKDRGEAYIREYGVVFSVQEPGALTFCLMEWSPTVHSLSLLVAIAAEDFNK